MTGATYLKKSKEAIQEMGDHNGASLSAIKKYFEEKPFWLQRTIYFLES